MPSTDNQSILRLLLALVVVTTGLSMYANVALQHTLPAPLYAFVHAQDNANMPTSQAFAAVVTLAWFALAIAGMAGLWWCRRWGRWAFTVASLALPIITVYVAIVDPTTLISNAIEFRRQHREQHGVRGNARHDLARHGRRFRRESGTRTAWHGVMATHLMTRHARPCAGHPRLVDVARKTWMAGTSSAMTVE